MGTGDRWFCKQRMLALTLENGTRNGGGMLIASCEVQEFVRGILCTRGVDRKVVVT